MTHDNEMPDEIYVSKATAKVLSALPASDTIKYTRTPPPSAEKKPIYLGKTFTIETVEDAAIIVRAWESKPYPPDKRLLAAIQALRTTALDNRAATTFFDRAMAAMARDAARIAKLETALRKIYNHGDSFAEPWSVEIARKALEE